MIDARDVAKVLFPTMRQLVRSTIRRALRLIPESIAIPIPYGEMRGILWIKGSSDNGCWVGTYEKCIQEVFAAHIKPGFVVYDVGAHVGFYTLLASRLVGESGKVIAFEPLPENLAYLRQHIRINKLTNVSVREVAISSTAGQGRFAKGISSSSGRLDDSGPIIVQSLTLDSLPPPDFIKIDIEGGEFSALQGGVKLLTNYAPIIVLATHGYDLQKTCRALLESLNYSVREITGPGADTGAQREFLCIKTA